jgi:hypothetical protein
MRIRCLARELTGEQHKEARANERMHPRYQITPGQDYLVFGITFLVDSVVYGNCCLFTILDDADRCVSIPSALGEVTDGRPSRFWVARTDERQGVALWPEEFYQRYFMDRLSDREADAVMAFLRVKEKIEGEFQSVSG